MDCASEINIIYNITRTAGYFTGNYLNTYCELYRKYYQNKIYKVNGPQNLLLK